MASRRGQRTRRSLGPARIDAMVEIEIRAAEIAASGRNGSGIDTWGEHDGWHAVSRKRPASARPFCASRPGHLAGYLARVIATHKELP